MASLINIVSFNTRTRQLLKSNLTIKNCYSGIEKKDIESYFKRRDLHIFVN